MLDKDPHKMERDKQRAVEVKIKVKEQAILKITLEELITASGKFPERLNSPDLTPQVKENLKKFRLILIEFLKELGVLKVTFSSGFRPIKANKKAGGATNSAHIRGLACDIEDNNGMLKQAIRENAEKYGYNDLLHKYKLWMEHEDFTPTWCHIDAAERWERKIRIFRPY